MTSQVAFDPDWAVPPGATLVAAVNERGIPLGEVHEKLGLSKAEFGALAVGQIRIDDLLAARIADLVGGAPEFWVKRDVAYLRDTRTQRTKWLEQLPIDQMQTFGWISRDADELVVEASCFAFFGVKSVEDWRKRYGARPTLARFRASRRHALELGAAAAWLRKGEVEARATHCRPWDSNVAMAAIPEMRRLTRVSSVQRFLPALQQLCAECGIALTVLPAIKGCPVSGAAKFLDDELAWIQMSFRYLTDDHFWFTFFHEIGHLLLHPSEEFVEDEESETDRAEHEANRFASDVLIPLQYRRELELVAEDYEGIIQFAKRIGISAGIVVGQMQHAGVVSYRKFNFLKRRYRWA